MVKNHHQLMIALSFGVTSGVITVLGLLVGLYEATASRLAVISGIVVLAIADGMADAIGLHAVEESEFENGKAKHSPKEVWLTTLFTFFSVSSCILLFTIPLLLLPLQTAIFASMGLGILMLVCFNYYVARYKRESALHIIFEHLLLVLLVVAASYFVGKWMGGWVGI